MPKIQANVRQWLMEHDTNEVPSGEGSGNVPERGLHDAFEADPVVDGDWKLCDLTRGLHFGCHASVRVDFARFRKVCRPPTRLCRLLLSVLFVSLYELFPL